MSQGRRAKSSEIKERSSHAVDARRAGYGRAIGIAARAGAPPSASGHEPWPATSPPAMRRRRGSQLAPRPGYAQSVAEQALNWTPAAPRLPGQYPQRLLMTRE